MGVLAPGAVLGGCRIEAVVGRGGMGVVYRARQLDLDRDVAVKVIAPELLDDLQAQRRFLREARAAGAVEHPNVVPVHGVGVAEGRAYLVMRYVAGEDLRTLVRRAGPLEPQRAAGIAQHVGDALDAIHAAGYVHRDVKPQNVMLDTDGHVYLSDFGLAKHAVATAGPTRSQQWVGTLDYVAPEQIRGERVDARADVYALGGVVFFMLTGHVPFEREHDQAKLWAHLADAPAPPSSLRPDLQPELDAVVLRALAKEPGQRQPSAGDLGRAVCAAAGGGGDSPERMVARGDAAPTTIAPRPRIEPRPRGRRPRAVAAAAALTLAAAAAAFALLRGDDAPERRSDAARTPEPTATATAPKPELPHVGKVTKTAGFRPRGVAVAGDRVFVVSAHEGRIARVDADTGLRRGRQKWIGHGATSIAADRDTIWVAGGERRAVIAVSVQTGKIQQLRAMPLTPRLVAAGPTGLWVVCSAELAGPSVLLRFDRQGMQQLGDLDLPSGVSAITLGGGYAWLALSDDRRVFRVAPDMALRTGAWLESPASELAYGAGYVWASVPSDDAVARIDPGTRNAITNTVASRPEQLIVARHRVFVASSTDHRIVVLSTRTGRRVGSVRVQPNPYGIAAGGRHLWVTGLGRSTLTRLDF